ncbi:MAG TPA: PAS domain S-box protein, partial [Burkholderiales bacterium]|nr:PAS domain S-box protein [Burkholderiales bacterium]
MPERKMAPLSAEDSRAAQAAARDELAQSEACYRSLFDANPEAVLVLCDSKVVLANPACVRLFGYASADALLNHWSGPHVDPADLLRARELVRRVVEERAAQPPLVLTLLRRDGSRVVVESTTLPIDYQGRPAVLSIMRDLTRERGAAKRVERLSNLRLAQSRTNEAIFRIADPAALAQAVCAIAVEQEGVTSAIVRRLDGEHGALDVLGAAGVQLGRIGVVPARLDDPGSAAVRVLREQRAQVRNDIDEGDWGNAAAEARQLGMRARAIFPLLDGGECSGVFVLLSTEAGFFDAELTALLEEMANNLATALAKRRAEAALARSEQYYGQLYARMPQGVRIICEGRVVLVNPAAERLFGVAAAGMIGKPAWEGIADQSRAWADERLRMVIEQRLPAPATEAVLRRPDGSQVEIESALLPVDYEGKPAAMAILHDLTARKAAERRVARLTSLYAGLSKTNEAILRVPGHLDLCQTVCEIAATHGDLLSAAIRMLDPESGMLEPYCGHGTLRGNFGLTAIPLDHPDSNAARTARELTYHVCNDIATDSDAARTRADAAAIGVRAFATFALTTDGELSGVFSVYAPETGFFDDELTGLLREMADNLCLAFSTRRAEAALAQSEERYRALFDASPDAIRVVCDGRAVMLNPACVRLLGCASVEEALAQPF